jgi:hypothetical protein
MATVRIHHEVMTGKPTTWRLCFQWVSYHHETERPVEFGYRFIWRKPNGNLQGARGQARIPSGADLMRLIAKASRAGWFVRVEPLPAGLELAEDES